MSTAVVVIYGTKYASFWKNKEKNYGGRQRQQWHFIPLPTRAGRKWQMVWQGPRLGFVAETGRFVAMEGVRFLACLFPCALLPSSRFSFFVFRFFSFFFPCISVCLSASCPFVCAASICYSQQVLGTCFILRFRSACIICTLPHLGILLFFIRLVFLSIFFP